MKITNLFLLFLLSFTLQSFAQLEKDSPKENQVLIKVKSILEKHFAGTNLRSIQRSFEIKPTKSDSYSFISDINGLFSEKSNQALATKLNKILRLKDNTNLTGVMYFDDRLDSALVNIEYKREDTVYQFFSMSGHAVPIGGFKAFSKRLHDFIKEQILLGKLVKDSVFVNATVNIFADRDGTFKQAKLNYLSKSIDKFLASEARWSPGINVPLAAVVNFSIIEYYINGDVWPLETTTVNRYQNNNDFESYVNIYTIAYFHDKNTPIFYSNKLLKHSGKTTISAVYDSMLKEYRLISIHDGNLNDTDRLVTLIRKEASKKFSPPEFNYSRVYFMLD